MIRTIIGLLQIILGVWIAIMLLPNPLAITYLVLTGITLLVATFMAGKESK